MQIDTAVLDHDGVVARSMEQHAEAYRRILEPLGVEVTQRDVFLREGARSESVLRDLMARAGKDPGPEEISRLADEKQRAFKQLGTPGPYEGTQDMVHRIREGAAQMALVTGTRRENLDLQIPDLLPRFDAVLAQDAYEHDKPHPEPYQKAAAALGVAPRRCVALENAPHGVKSAKAAGYAWVVALTTTLEAAVLEEAGADRVVPDHGAAADAVLEVLRGGPA